MMLSDDKISHMTHVLLKELMDKDLIDIIEEESEVRREIKRTLISELKIGEEMDVVVRKKLESYSRQLVEGSPEWDVLYERFFNEEEVRRGKK
ncbi:MAG: DUF507 family protein [Dissulfurispiraceae bacterium]|jgi:hypothetical protein|nr:DUF507 family protein [Dissulfurispiraceae bacterium]